MWSCEGQDFHHFVQCPCLIYGSLVAPGPAHFTLRFSAFVRLEHLKLEPIYLVCFFSSSLSLHFQVLMHPIIMTPCLLQCCMSCTTFSSRFLCTEPCCTENLTCAVLLVGFQCTLISSHLLPRKEASDPDCHFRMTKSSLPPCPIKDNMTGEKL